MARSIYQKYAYAAWWVFVVIVVIATLSYVFSFMSAQDIENLTLTLGAWGPAILIIYFVIGHVVAPISGMPMWLAGFAVYGWRVFLFLYIANLISSPINFWISRHLGRKWVVKLGGKSTLDKVDKALEKASTEMLIVGRLVGFSLFDIISYAGGFMPISFKKYYSITAICSFIPLMIFAFVLKDIVLDAWNIVLLCLLAISFLLLYLVTMHREYFKI